MKKLLIAMLLIATPALAQQQPPDPAFLQRALGALQAQRNQALDNAAAQQARADGLQEELQKAQAQIKSFEEKKPEPKK